MPYDNKRKPDLSIIIGKLKPRGMMASKDGEEEMQDSPVGENEELKVAAEEILSAIEEKDAEALSESLHAFFEICDAQPHEEGEHVEE